MFVETIDDAAEVDGDWRSGRPERDDGRMPVT